MKNRSINCCENVKSFRVRLNTGSGGYVQDNQELDGSSILEGIRMSRYSSGGLDEDSFKSLRC